MLFLRTSVLNVGINRGKWVSTLKKCITSMLLISINSLPDLSLASLLSLRFLEEGLEVLRRLQLA